jgi:hypothetical protein
MDRNLNDRKKRSDATWSRHRRWLASIALTVVAGLILVPVLLAVHDEAFQLDADVIHSTTTNYGGTTQTVDWDLIFNNGGTNGTGKVISPLPTGFGHATFTPDFGLNTNGSFNTNDATTYTTGSKDTLSITPGWQCTVSNNVNSKVDLINVYATDYTDPAGNRFLYFGLERNVNTGDANVGFWFLQGDANCVSAGGTTAWTGHHSDGDLLIVSAFTKGGNVSGITAYAWSCTGLSGAACDAQGFLNLTPVADSGDCRDGAHPLNDPICAVANEGTISTPWLTVNKTTVNHSLDHGEFFEGGINLTQTGFGDKCFNTFVGDTRSSQSPTATIFDYARGELGECASTTSTLANTANPTSIGTGSVASNHDTATIHVDGVATFNGTVTFYLCGPSVSTITLPCGTGTLVDGTSGGTAGTKIGSSQTVTVNGTKTSDNVTLTSVGNYCWGAIFSGDSVAGVPASQDDGTGECFSISPVTPVLDTQAGTSPVNLGSPVTDTASLSGTATKPGTNGIGADGSINATNGAASGGKITFTLRGPDDPGATPPVCSTTTVTGGTGTNPQDVTGVSGDGTYPGSGSVSYTTAAPGKYHWVAIYTSDNVNNNNSALHDSDCSDSDENVVVQQIPTQIKTKQDWIPNDTVTITSTNNSFNLPAGGTLVFTLYDTATCTGNVKFTESTSGGLTGGNVSEEVTTHNTGTGTGMFRITTNYTDASTTTGTFSWKVVYTPPAGAFIGIQSSCTTVPAEGRAETFSITYQNDPGTGTKLP